MDARPILLVADPLASGIKMHYETAEHLAQAGYLVLHCKQEDFESLKVLAPAPFTDADVVALRSMAAAERRENGDAIDDAHILDSLADRIEAML